MRTSVLLLALVGLSFASVCLSQPSTLPASFGDVNADNIDAAFAALADSNSTVGASPNGGTYGVDLSAGASKGGFHCLRSKGFEFAVIRAWQSLCRVDPKAVSTIKSAWAGGMKEVHVYLYPARQCSKSAATQVADTVKALKGTKFNMLWFDIETAYSGWGSHSENVAWLVAGVNEAEKLLGKSRVGIYSSNSAWSAIMGGSTKFSHLPIWYAHYDARPSFSDWHNFGGWSKPWAKQFNDGPTVCGVGVDHNWRP